MNYLLIEFLGVFFLVFYKGIANILVDANHYYYVFNALVTGFILIIFVNYSEGLSRGMFNSSFAIVENLWKNMSIDSTLGYVCAHIIACFTATSVLSLVIPFDVVKKGNTVDLGVMQIDHRNDYFSIFTVEMVGAFLLFFGFLYYSGLKASERQGFAAVYYGCLAAALQLANYSITGGVYNLTLMIGGILFDSTLDSKLLALFCGNIFGTVVAKLLYVQILGPRKEKEVNKTLKMMLNK